MQESGNKVSCALFLILIPNLSSIELLELCLLSSSSHFRFKTLDISLDFLVGTVRNMNIVMDFFSNQIDLEKLELAIFAGSNRTREMKALLFFVIKKMPKLKELSLRGTDIHFSGAEFNEFLLRIGRLESFEFFSTLYTPWPHEVLPNMPTSGSPYSMTKLQLPFYQEGLKSDHAEQICLSILSHCYSLQYLSLGFVTEEILNQIFKVHVCYTPQQVI